MIPNLTCTSFRKKENHCKIHPFFGGKLLDAMILMFFFSIWKAELRHLLRKRICGGNLQESRPVVIFVCKGGWGRREMSLDFLGLYITLRGRFFSYVISINLRNKMWFRSGIRYLKWIPKKNIYLKTWSFKICPRILLWRSKMWTFFLGSRWWFQSFFMFTPILGGMIQFD